MKVAILDNETSIPLSIIKRYSELSGVPIFAYAYHNETSVFAADFVRVDEGRYDYLLSMDLGEGPIPEPVLYDADCWFNENSILRNSRAFIQAVEENKGSMVIVEIPDDVDFHIFENEDGSEEIHEDHRVWTKFSVPNEEKLSNKERVLNYCREVKTNSTEVLESRDDVERRVKKYPEDKEGWFDSCPSCWGLNEFDNLGLCEFTSSQKKFTSKEEMIGCRDCWLLALSEPVNKTYLCILGGKSEAEESSDIFVDFLRGEDYKAIAQTESYTLLEKDGRHCVVSSDSLRGHFVETRSLTKLEAASYNNVLVGMGSPTGKNLKEYLEERE